MTGKQTAAVVGGQQVSKGMHSEPRRCPEVAVVVEGNGSAFVVGQRSTCVNPTTVFWRQGSVKVHPRPDTLSPHSVSALKPGALASRSFFEVRTIKQSGCCRQMVKNVQIQTTCRTGSEWTSRSQKSPGGTE